jgi:hypothetical protein
MCVAVGPAPELKRKCFRAYVLPILLFGSETWALTKQQAERLEVAHSDCLRQILNMRRADRHSKQHCGHSVELSA